MRFVNVNGVLVDQRILHNYFSCDYEKCNGACCWAVLDDIELDGGTLTQEEANFIRKNREVAAKFVDERCKSEVLSKPVYQRGSRYFTSMQKETGRCLFSNSECKTCALKTMKENGFATDIPINCELYPIWLSESKGVKYLSLIDTFEEYYCKPAIEKGQRENTKVYQFCKNSIIRLFGEDFYNALHRKTTNSENLFL